MGQAKLKRALGAEGATPKIKAGAVKTLAMYGSADNGAASRRNPERRAPHPPLTILSH